jgi:hypothetical protein
MAANARMPDTKIRPPATTKIRLTELRLVPPKQARKLRRTVLVRSITADEFSRHLGAGLALQGPVVIEVSL